jgi:hypothetical protein
MFVVTGVMRRLNQEERQSAFEQRLRSFQDQSQASKLIGPAKEQESRGRVSEMMSSVSLWVGEQMVSSRGGLSILDWLDGQLASAGSPRGWQATDLLARVLVALVGVLAIGAWSVQVQGSSPIIFAVLLVAVLYYPVLWLRSKITLRKEQAFGELRYFLDELILSLSSQTSTIDQALRSILFESQEQQTGLKESERVLVTEFRRAYTESEGQSRPFEDAYRDAAARIGVDLVSDLVDLLINAKLEGSPVLSSLTELREQVQRLFGEEISARIKKLDSTMTIATVMVMGGCAINLVLPILSSVMQSLQGSVS